MGFIWLLLAWGGLVAVMTVLILQDRVHGWDSYLLGATLAVVIAVLAVVLIAMGER